MALQKLSAAASSIGLGCLLLMAHPAQAQTPTVHKLGILTASDPQLGDGSYFDSYEIEGSAGQQVSISLDSSDFDAFLGLVDSEGNLIASNDDATGTNQNSFLSLTLPKDGVYTVVATSLTPQTSGDYRLALRNFSPPSRSASSGRSELNTVYDPAALGFLALMMGAFMFGDSGYESSAGSNPADDPTMRDASSVRPPAPQPSPPPIQSQWEFYN